MARITTTGNETELYHNKKDLLAVNIQQEHNIMQHKANI